MRTMLGTVLTLPGVVAAELLAEPFDVVWIDLEHGALGRHEAQDMLIGAQAAGAIALVRLPAHEHGLIAAMLDAGADGIVLAVVDDAPQAVAAVAAVRHPPAGRRGYGPRRLALRGRTVASGSVDPLVWAQIETASGVAAADAIAAVDGVDALIVGTADLSFALGVPLRTDAPELVAAVAAVRGAAHENGCAFGVAGALIDAAPGLTSGADILVHSTDARMCAAAVDGAADRLRSRTSSEAGEPQCR